jgi:hypothetical protein
MLASPAGTTTTAVAAVATVAAKRCDNKHCN